MTMQGMERDPLNKLETGAIPIGHDRSPFVIPMNPSRMWIDLPGNGAWGDGKRGRYKDKKGRCDWCAVQRFILAGVILTFILWASMYGRLVIAFRYFGGITPATASSITGAQTIVCVLHVLFLTLFIFILSDFAQGDVLHRRGDF